MAYKLILLRHGESTWNAKNLFTGWVDVDLSEKGVVEAARAGQLLKEANLLPDVLHTSLLKRAINTADIALSNCGKTGVPTDRSWRLNERHYGALQGKDKASTLLSMAKNNLIYGAGPLISHLLQLQMMISTHKKMIHGMQI